MENRKCGPCQLCCKLMPIAETGKAAGVKCPQQRFRKGCAIYGTRPNSCRYWECGWLTEPLLADLSRPDIAGYVVDMTADFLTAQVGDPERIERFKIIQIWCDPRSPHAHRDPALRAYLEDMLAQEYLGVVRYGASEGLALIPPACSRRGWVEFPTTSDGREHTFSEYQRYFG
jgi:hypothetical protein